MNLSTLDNGVRGVRYFPRAVAQNYLEGAVSHFNLDRFITYVSCPRVFERDVFQYDPWCLGASKWSEDRE